MEALTPASADDLPPLGELIVDDPFWRPAWGLAQEGFGHLRLWVTATVSSRYVAVVTDTGSITSVTESAGRIWAGLARRLGPSLVLLEHQPAPESGEGIAILDLVRIGADGEPRRVGTALWAGNARRSFRAVLTAAGLDPAEWTPRELRHSFVICTAFRPEARRNLGLAASCLRSICHSVRQVQQGRYQGLSLFAAAFDLTWLTCLSSGNRHLPGTLRFTVQITTVSLMSDAGVPIEKTGPLVGHTGTTTTETIYRIYIRPVVVGGTEIMDSLFPMRNADA